MLLALRRPAVLARLLRVCATVSVIGIYWFLARCDGPFLHRAPDYYYSRLAYSFQGGHVHLDVEQDPRLAKLPNPYDPDARKGISFPWDASYYRGKISLYFSPVPALGLWLFRALFGGYPPEWFLGFVLTSATFLLLIAFWRVFRGAYPGVVWIVILGLGNPFLFALSTVNTYQIAILCSVFFGTLASALLVRWLENPDRLWVLSLSSACVAIAACGRPNAGIGYVLLLAFAVAKAYPQTRVVGVRVLAILAGCLPLLLAQGAYNFARYENCFELGQQYQLSLLDMTRFPICSFPKTAESFAGYLSRLTTYLALAPTWGGYFPYVYLRPPSLAPGSPLGIPTEEAVGALFAFPMLWGVALTKGLRALGYLPKLGADGVSREHRRLGALFLVGGFLVLLATSSCLLVVQRYVIDAAPFLLCGLIVMVGVDERSGVPSRADSFCRIAVLFLAVLFCVLPSLAGNFRTNLAEPSPVVKWLRETLPGFPSRDARGTGPAIDGVLEAESLLLLGKTDGLVARTFIAQGSGAQLSRDAFLWIGSEKPGAWVEFLFPAPRTGDYHVFGYFPRARDFGIVRVSINGIPVPGEVDLYHERFAATGGVSFGRYPLAPKGNRLRLEVVGHHPSTVPPHYVMGLDGIRLEPVAP